MWDGGCRLRFVYIQQGYEIIDLKASPLNSNKENRSMLSEQRISSMCFMMSNVAFWKLTVVSAACSELKVLRKNMAIANTNFHHLFMSQARQCAFDANSPILAIPPSSLVVGLLKKELTIQVTLHNVMFGRSLRSASRSPLVRASAYAVSTQLCSGLIHHVVAATTNHTLALYPENAHPKSAPIHACISLC